MKKNEANWDRIARTVAGIVLLYLGFGGVLSGAAAVVADVVGVILLATGVVGWCPIYWATKIRTLRDSA